MKKLLVWMFMVMVTAANAQITITGKIMGDNEPLIGATVREKGGTSAAMSDIDGNYTLSVKNSQGVLVFTMVGFVTKEIPYNGQQTIDVYLDSDTKLMEEVVVIGYGVVKKSDLTSSITSVKGDELKTMNAGNAMLSMQGKANGVQITSAGGPGATPRVIIRGVTTINGSDPLYVVDGFPVGNNINFLNQDEIESIEVLKDASAAAIYGTRGSNGVIMITTKKGSQGKTKFTLNANYGFTTVNKPNLADASTFEKVFKERYTNDGNVPVWNTPEGLGINTDWWDQTVKTGYTQNYNFSFQGGDKKFVYSGSVGYFGEKSQFDVGKWERFTARFNTEYNFNSYVKAGINMAPKFETWKDTPNLFGAAMKMDPTTPVLKAENLWDSNPFNNYARSYNNQEWNPVASVARQNSGSNEYGMMMIPFLSIEPIKGLIARTQYSVNARFRMSDSFTPKFFIDNLERNDLASASRNVSHWVDWNWTNTLNYNTTFSNKHNVNLMGGFTMERFADYWINGSRAGIPSNHPNLQYVSAGTLNEAASGSNTFTSLMSYLGRAMYNYDSKYYVTASFRVDGSSKFPEGNKYATFPAVSLAWRASEEAFLKDLNVFSDLKIRAGWGRVGNQSINPNLYLNLIGAADYVFNGDRNVGTAISLVGNRLLTWETVEDYNFGVDASFLNNRLNIVADWFTKKSKDMLMARQNLSILGYPMWAGEMMTNIGSMQARGWEFSANWRDKASNDFNYEVGVNLSSVKNKALTLVDNTPILRGGFFNDYIVRNEEGAEISRFYGFIADGIFQNQTEINSHTSERGDLLQPNAVPGDIRFKDLNNDGVLDDKDKTYIGNAFPNLMLGLNLKLAYKNFDLVTNFYGTFGNDIYNSAKGGFYAGTNGQNVYADAYDKAWRGEGSTNFYPRLSVNDRNLNFRRVSSFFVEDGSYLRAKLIQLGYNIPSSLTKGLNVRVSASAQNLFTITNYSGLDPEGAAMGSVLESGIDNLAYPNPKSFLLGVNINF
ncbi:TonB-dependent receptor [Leadbetterella byssophila DSM 17132]|uniref:TonB-dependent receptor n=1 Tax=Leadbetterella byssophila (strain DSM 17132 / JCM 16389 / KACC 11308 / NBRC 106382 / 4M15) TaxID=649349 RepID=E4RQL7_LEAB4|nr:TonB-dependent receptor [Leadbetterella byssophila]ADQ16583.1 TonB-dependent receptor [Leadbetterella byssophila DSM 17132]